MACLCLCGGMDDLRKTQPSRLKLHLPNSVSLHCLMCISPFVFTTTDSNSSNGLVHEYSAADSICNAAFASGSRYVDIKDSTAMENELNQICIGAFKIKANRARFSRKEKHIAGETIQSKETPGKRFSVIMPNITYADMVKKMYEKGGQTQEGNQNAKQKPVQCVEVRTRTVQNIR
ncbi:hypothetical protein Ancab_008374 [Ancistrocladus abbreviatus]